MSSAVNRDVPAGGAVRPNGVDPNTVWRVGITIVALLALVFGVVAWMRDDKQPGTITPGSGAPATDSSGSTTVIAHLTEFRITLDPPQVPPGRVIFDVMNMGSTIHNLSLVGTDKITKNLAQGETAQLDVGELAAGKYTLVCTISGHQAAGMKTTMTVAAGAGSTGAAGGATTSTSMDYAAMSRAMNESIKRFPAKTDGEGNQVLSPTVLPDGTKRFELTAAITKWEVEPGKLVDAWTYNGAVPGPLLKVNVGDQVEVLLHNKLPAATDVHFHGANLPFDQDGVAPITQPLIEPGTDYTYKFVADKPAVAMYHAHHMAQLQVPNGMLGTFLIGEMPMPTTIPAGGSVAAGPADIRVSQEIPMVLNDAGVIGFSLNGKGFPATAPIAGKQGEWIEVHYLNEGMVAHPMHMHGFPQLVIAKDGIPLESPYWMDTLNVAPGERYTVLANLNLKGTWVWHCHILNHVERDTGMFGMVTAVVVS